MKSNASLALLYANAGVHVFPCLEGCIGNQSAKAPYILNGWHGASANPLQIAEWWNRWPRAVIGLPCRMNGIVAIDADRHGGNDGVNALSDVFNRHAFNAYSVPVVTTPRNGLHFFFQIQSTFPATKGRLTDTVDIRDKAYVIAGGSTMGEGRSYKLCNGTLEQFASAVAKLTLPTLPGWLVSLVIKPQHEFKPSNQTPPNLLVDNLHCRISGLVRKVVLARKGERNAMLHWASCRAGELVTLKLVSGDVAEALMIEAGRQASLPKHEVYATVKSGLRASSRAL
jgi:hypothetical protein